MPESPAPQRATWVTPRGEICFNWDAVPLPATHQRALSDAPDTGATVLYLGARRLPVGLPADVLFWRQLGQLFMTHLCLQGSLEGTREALDLPAPSQALANLLTKLPPMHGAEYVDAALLARVWQGMLLAYRRDIAGFDGTVHAYLQHLDAAWHNVGRVCFHLAENKNDAERPFAFLTTYTEGLSANHRPKHIPLAQALQSATGDTGMLERILEPVRRAAGEQAWLQALIQSRALFVPQAWDTEAAYTLLRSIPACEAAGITVRVPDWWRRRPRPRVTVTVGKKPPAGLNAEALLDFDVDVVIDGEHLTAKELKSLSDAHGLVQLRGRWVEVDGARLQQALSQFEALKREHVAGVDFSTGMRLLAGMPDTPAATAADAGEAEASDWFAVQAGSWLENALAQARSSDAEPPSDLHATLRPYQRTGAHWLLSMRLLGMGACLADDMGLGKTLQILTLLLWIRPSQRPSLLVVPASLLGNWQQEALRFAPALRMVVAHASAGTAQPDIQHADVVLTTYGMVARQTWLREMAWDVVVLDEAQAIKNPGTRNTRAVKQLQARQRVVLTGTPVENRAMDLWSLFDFINPGLLGTPKVFGQHVKSFEREGGPGYTPLRRLVRPYILRRLKTDTQVIADLPEKTELTAWCGLRRPQVALYQQAVTALKRQLAEALPQQRRGVVLATMTRLKQICNHPSHWLGDGVYDPDDSGKFIRLREIAETIAARQEKLLVFTQYREMVEPLRGYLAGIFQYPGVILHGGTTVKSRPKLVRMFQNDTSVPFMVLSLKAGGTGLNLTAANHVVHFDRWWNPAVEQQATDRAFRIGQTRGVLVHKFVCRGSVEEKIDGMLQAKQALSQELLSASGEVALTEMSDTELLATLRLDMTRAMES